MAYTHLLFDFDHLLFDTDQSEALAFGWALSQHGVSQPDSLLAQYRRINMALWRQVELGNISPNDLKTERFESLAVECELDYDAPAVADAYTEGLARYGDLYDGAFDLVTDLSESHQLAMITNGLGPVQRGRLERVGLLDAFHPLVISGEVGLAKPRSEIFSLVFDVYPDADRNGYLMIGDSLTSDVAGGINAGIDTCWYNPHGLDSGGRPVTHEISTLDGLRKVVE